MIQLIKCDLYKIVHSKLSNLIGIFTGGFCVLVMFLFLIADSVDKLWTEPYPMMQISILKSVIFPLSIILISNLLISQELEQRTINIYLIKGYNYDQIISSKIIGNIIATFVVVMGTMIIAYICAIPIELAGINLWSGEIDIFTKIFNDIKVCILVFISLIPVCIFSSVICIEFKETIKSIIIALVIYFSLFKISVSFPNIGQYLFTYYIDEFLHFNRVTGEIEEVSSLVTIIGVLVIIGYSLLLYIYGIWRFAKKYKEES